MTLNHFKWFSILRVHPIGWCLILLYSIVSCTSTEVITKEISSTHMPKPELPKEIPTSEITLTYEISKWAMSKYLDEVLDSIFAETFSFPDQNVEVHISRMKNGSVEVLGQRVLTTIPIYVDIDKSTFVGNLSAYGEMELKIVSDIDIATDWQMTTFTEVIDYQWTVSPKVKLGIIDLPIQTITDNLLDKVKPIIEKNIDEGIKENYSLKENISSLGEVLFTPYQLDSTAGGWIKMKADSVHMSPWENKENYSQGKIYTKMTMMMDSNPADTLSDKRIPPFSWKESINDNSTFRLWADLSYDYLTKIVQSNFLGQTFKNGSREVKVEDVIITGDQDQIIVQARTSGSFNGTITISGQPVYKDGILRATNILWDVKTNNLLHKAATWIKKGFIHDQLNNMLVFDLESYLERTKGEIYNYLSDLKRSSDIDVTIDWHNIGLSDIRTEKEGLVTMMQADMTIHVIVDDINFIKSLQY